MTLELNCANFSDNKSKAPIIPPDGLKKHPYKVDRNSIKELEKSGEVGKVVIPAYDGGLNKDNKDNEITM